jgi:hypothetical protein
MRALLRRRLATPGGGLFDGFLRKGLFQLSLDLGGRATNEVAGRAAVRELGKFGRNPTWCCGADHGQELPLGASSRTSALGWLLSFTDDPLTVRSCTETAWSEEARFSPTDSSQ